MIARAIERPVTVLVGVILVVLFGTLALTELPIQLTPDIAVPTLTVSTRWPGAAPLEVEAEILEEQEEALKSLAGLEKMTSEARLERGTITLELAVGTSIDEAMVRVTNLLSQVPSYPETADQPVVTAANSSGPPLAVLTVVSERGEDVTQYYTWLDQHVSPRFSRIPGVADVRLFGGRETEVEIHFDAKALAARGLAITEVANVLRGELQDLSGGDLTVGKRRFLVRIPLAPKTVEELEEVVLRTDADGTAILLRDVADVRISLRKPDAMVMSDDRRSMAYLLFREAGTNVLEVTNQIKEAARDIQEEQLAQRGLRMRLVSEQTGYIEAALSLVRQNLVVGGLLAVVVLLLFLGSLRASAVVSIAIPVCTLGTALGMSLLGRTVNVVSLAGMAFAVGMVVDNAIVVLENIDTVKNRGVDVRRAALLGAKDVWGAILASTLTTAVVFIPIIGWQDEVGEILRDIAVAISVAVIVSLVVSVLVIPSFSVVMLSEKPKSHGAWSKVTEAADRMRVSLGAFVGRMVASSSTSVTVVLLALGLSVGATVAWLPSMEYLPTGNRAFVFGILVPPPGYSVEEMGRIGEDLQSRVGQHVGVEKDGVPAIERSFYVGNPANAFMGAAVVDETRTMDLVRWYRATMAKVPGMFAIANQASLFGRSIGAARGVEVELAGSDLGVLVGIGGRMLGAIKQELPGSQVRPIPSLDLGAPELHVTPKRRQAAAVGMSGRDLGLTVDALVDGAIIGEVGEEGKPKVNVVLAASEQVGDPATLAAAQVATPKGEVVTLDTIAQIDQALGPTVIRRIERRRAITIQVSPPDDVPLEDAMSRIRANVVAKLRGSGVIPRDVDVRLSGTAGQLELAKSRFLDVLLLAVLISFLLMSALFEDFVAPVAVMITVPLAAAGGVIGLLLVDRFLGKQDFDMLTAIGFVILIGVVVNNAILVVDGALTRLKQGDGLVAAVQAAVEGRIRPIFMSALTSLAGLSPLVLFPGSGSELYRGVGAVVLGGLALSTVLTLFVVPALFSILWRLRGVK